MRRGNLLSECGGGCGIGLQRRDDVNPVERAKLVEVHHMVLHIKRQFHDVANALGESPGITRIASLEDDFNATPHGSAGQRVVDGVVRAQSGFDAKVPFDAGDWVNYDSLCHGSAPRYSFVLSGDFSFPLAASTVRRPT